MVFSKRIVKEKQQALLNVEEAYNLWDLINSHYFMLQQTKQLVIFTHDKDLKLLMHGMAKKREQNTTDLEKHLKEYKLGGPKGPRKHFNTSVNLEILHDKDIASILLLTYQGDIELLLRAIRTSTTNDHVRELFIEFAKEAIDDLDDIMKYLKIKGWINQPPLYPNIPNGTKEKLDAGEAFHLWDHLTFRYDNIYDTQLWYEYTHDGDFKELLKIGLQATLKKQATMLENELATFGIPLPETPPTIVKSEDTSLQSDEYIFRNLYRGIVGAQWLHALALKQCTTNDRVRKIFKDLLLSEIEMLDNLIKFGKIKSWLNPAPNFTPSQ